MLNKWQMKGSIQCNATQESPTVKITVVVKVLVSVVHVCQVNPL